MLNDQGSYQYIYPMEHTEYVQSVFHYNSALEEIYRKTFGWRLDEKTSVILASNRNQIANAFATTMPNNMNVLYNGGAEIIDQFAIKSWMFTLLAHEGAHLYHLNTKRGPTQFLHKIFGNALLHIFYIVPIFTTPNMFLPTWLVEGNAVLNESLFGNGGRLYSGEERALFYALVKSNRLNAKRLTNNHNEFPYGHEKYNVGGYFYLFLAEQYGISRTNQFFYHHANHYINPFIVNSAFFRAFDKGYYTLIREFLEHYQDRASKQQSSDGRLVAKTVSLQPMTRDGNQIYFLTTTGKQYPTLNVLNTQTGDHKKIRTTLPMGRVFNIDGTFYSATSDLVNPKNILYSLWNENGYDLKKYRSKLLVSKQGKNELWFDMKKSFDEPLLMKDNSEVGHINSSALFDKAGNVYFFKQQGKTRTLYKNSTPLTSFTGYYGKIADVDVDGGVYFISTTPYGSSLFEYRNGKTLRLSNSDTIVDGRQLPNNQFLISEVTDTGYEYKIISTKRNESRPDSYTYFFEKDENFSLYGRGTFNKKNDLLTEREYSMWRDLRYSSTSTFSQIIDGSPLISFMSIFTDPLNYHDITFSLNFNKYNGNESYLLQYSFNKFIVNLYGSVEYEKEYPTTADPFDDREEGMKYRFGFDTFFMKTGHTNWYLQNEFLYDGIDKLWGNYTSLLLDNTKDFALTFHPYRNISLLLEHLSFEDGVTESSALANVYHGFDYETFFQGHILYKRSNEDDLHISDPIVANTPLPATIGYTIYSPFEFYQTALRGSAQLSKVINWGLYFEKFPVSLRRFAPKVLYNHYYVKSDFHEYDFYEYGYGADFELLFLHLAPLKIGYATITNRNKVTSDVINIAYNTTF